MFPVGRIRAVQACKPKQNERSNLRLRRRLINTFPTRRTATRGIHRQRTVASRPTCALFFFFRFDPNPIIQIYHVVVFCLFCVRVCVCVCVFFSDCQRSKQGRVQPPYNTPCGPELSSEQNASLSSPPDPRISISSSLAGSDTYYENLTRMGWGRRGGKGSIGRVHAESFGTYPR